MIDVIISNLPTIIGLGILLGGTIFGVIKYRDKKTKETVNIKSRVTNLETDFEEEKRGADEHHRRLYRELTKQGKDIAFIRGKIEKL